ncbi:sensor histidine kinase [Spirosoma fluviale]|uniref:Histidine kinase n=1 Tax=Spirosoma fluviale TaxID=1597977 RepID=A0A286FEG8_9BACT|nr:sensor histidine kinase [Spirosoma fluviale]SOD81593.1 Histidine kinase [Spirosoma fluviale]
MMAYRTNWITRPARVIRRPRFFSKYEWRYHLFMMPLLFPVGNYYLIGPRYFTDPLVFAVGTGLVFILYWLSIVALTLTIRAVIQRYPTASQTLVRMLIMLATVSALTSLLACLDVWVYSLVPLTGTQFTWSATRPILVLGLLFGVFLCMVLGLVYMYSQWNKDLREDEELQRESIQGQYDSLKGQLNPHFLFNALNSLSVLISEEPRLAEEFVDKLASVYRYMLQPGRQVDAGATSPPGELVTLLAELEFIDSYADLLEIRYGKSLQIKRPDRQKIPFADYRLPPLTIQTLIDNAIKHNGMSAEKPLIIRIDITTEGWLRVTNNRQQKVIRMEMGGPGLSGLTAKYRRLSEKSPAIESTDTYYRVALPLLFSGTG